MTPFLQIAGWALIHFVWQAGVIPAVASALLTATARRSAGLRYLIGCASLVAMLAAPAVTARLVWMADHSGAGQRVHGAVQREGATFEGTGAASAGAASSGRDR